MNNKLVKKGFVIAFAVLIVTAVLPIITGQINNLIGCESSVSAVTVGDLFDVTVWLDAADPVDSWLINLLNFNQTIPGMITANTVTISSGWTTGFYDNGTINNNLGTITGIQAFIMTPSTTNTSIFTVYFTAVKPGLCYITLTEAEAYSGGPNVLDEWYNTSILIHPQQPTGLTATTVNQNTIDLNWTLQAGIEKTLIRYKTGSYPTSVTDGTELYNGTGTSTSHMGLSPGDTIYYSAWGWNDTANLYSLNYDTVVGQTTGLLNNPPVFSDNDPTNRSSDVSVDLSALSITIVDPDGDSFNWSIETSPDIGSSSDTGDVNGSKTCSVSGIQYSTSYIWYVNCTDGTYWTRAWFSFSTEAAGPETVYVNDDNTGGPWNGTQEYPYQFIQDGVTAVGIGGSVYVDEGTYVENIEINKSLDLIGAGARSTIIKASGLDHIITIVADNVNISGFTMTEANLSKTAGIYLNNADYCNIIDNNASNNYYGIWLKSSDNNMLTNNTVSNIMDGIYITGSSSNTIKNNNALDNTNGVLLYDSVDNTLTDNTVSGNDQGIYLMNSTDTLVTNNNVVSNNYGIYLERSSSNTVTTNVAINNLKGIYLDGSLNNIVTSNNASGNTDGLYLIDSQGNSISSNYIFDNSKGINHRFSSSNSIINNIISNNTDGIYLSSSDTTLISNNYFENTNNAWDDGNNRWNITTTMPGTNIIGGSYLGGNYWHDYTGKDLDGDGLGDTSLPHSSSGNILRGGDYHPLTTPYANNPPNKPSTPVGTIMGKARVLYSYTSVVTDPDGDQVYYLFDWGDGSDSGWIGPVNSGKAVEDEHGWSSRGNYVIRVKAKDVYGVESPWSDPLPISMPKVGLSIKQICVEILERLMERFPFLEHLFLSHPFFSRLLGV